MKVYILKIKDFDGDADFLDVQILLFSTLEKAVKKCLELIDEEIAHWDLGNDSIKENYNLIKNNKISQFDETLVCYNSNAYFNKKNCS
jgi:hypothetical protein